MNPVLESLFKHRSIRKYKNQPLEKEKLELIIKAAQAAPTWWNGEQVSIIQLKTKPEKKFSKNYVGDKNTFLNAQYF